jgi:hypothetical protein
MTSDTSSTSSTLNVSFNTEENTEAAIKFFSDTVQWASWNAMPEHTDTLKIYGCPILIKQKIEDSRFSVPFRCLHI